MPELPEVEVIKLGLEKKIIGLKIQKIQVLSPKSFQNEKGEPFDCAQGLRGQIVLKIWRRAKILGIDLGDITLLFHLKMSGQLVWEGYRQQGTGDSKFIGGHPTEDMLGKMPNPHTRVIFSFADGSRLYFNDLRKFGWVRVVDSGQVTGDSSIKNLGPEPLEKEFSWQILKQNLLKHKKTPIKVAIMDQTVLSGVG
ncbi:MAG: DNA-formamidopyrimidine glycosylase family protein, partial [Candidatus Daviesbacteria bacterium]|nr:DNA-formamidopyrimidine glycosylase family protein [Candidatus Daviesbacteria bacterium]